MAGDLVLGGAPMKVRILSLFRYPIPYVKELQPLAGSVVGCILMLQLDYWFERKPDGFYKFMSPCKHPGYKQGQSWTEELGCSVFEFRSAFDKIGHRWNTRAEFAKALDKFQGKYYASYIDKKTNKTWYCRNDDLLDSALLEWAIVPANYSRAKSQTTENKADAETESAEIEKFNVDRLTNPTPTAADNASLHIEKLHLPYTDTTQIPPQPTTVSGTELYIPNSFPPTDRATMLRLVKDLDLKLAQKIINVVVELKKQGAVRTTVTRLTRGLVQKAKKGEFWPDPGLDDAADHKLKMENDVRIRALADKDMPIATPSVVSANLKKLKEITGSGRPVLF